MDKKLFGTRLNTLLHERELTQREAGRLMGVSYVCISRYVKGTRIPKITNVAQLAKGLGVSVDYLIGLSDEKDIKTPAYWDKEHSGGFTPGGNPAYRCSKCGWHFGTSMIYPNLKYCPECGSPMGVKTDWK